jgi:hypothetical protein
VRSGLSVASGMPAQKTYLMLVILLHFLQLVHNDDGLVKQMLKIWAVSVEQLKLDLILETLEKRAYFFSSVLMSSVVYLDS